MFRRIGLTVAKALKILDFVKRNTLQLFSSSTYPQTLYFALVRSVFKFSVVIWHPHFAKDHLRIERVQNRFLSFASLTFKRNVPAHNYKLLLSILNILSLSVRQAPINSRFLSTLILNGPTNALDPLFRISFKVSCHPTRNQNRFHTPRHTTSYWQNNLIRKMLRNSTAICNHNIIVKLYFIIGICTIIILIASKCYADLFQPIYHSFGVK